MKAVLRFYREFPHLCHAACSVLVGVALLGIVVAGHASNDGALAGLLVLQVANLLVWRRLPHGR